MASHFGTDLFGSPPSPNLTPKSCQQLSPGLWSWWGFPGCTPSGGRVESGASLNFELVDWGYLVCRFAGQDFPQTEQYSAVCKAVGGHHCLPSGRSCSHCTDAASCCWRVSQKHSWSGISDLSYTSRSPCRQTKYSQPIGLSWQSQTPKTEWTEYIF